ncbi:MAG: hypothetical protein M0P91_08715 [Sulfuricurvum sp.]|jgi:hypothetical protein|uniref:hypothetical protein n=1 Tax=Sulfuricurvum sp. TaxID=2025608 RepID=UPI0025F25914|nr:hypothetical protein [Sulfuricurvum sp.]MCK9373267.1 hypothetical protein [Sulfuricurvum sp.]
MGKFKNHRKEGFLASIPIISLVDSSNDLTKRCKFNFSYFDVQDGISQNFEDWEHFELIKLLEKMKNYSKESLEFWTKQNVGSFHVLEIYGSFPVNSDFTQPKHIPHQAEWARFHLENLVRVIGFVIPEEYHNNSHPTTRMLFDKNTFYVVYLDRDHRFYKTER